MIDSIWDKAVYNDGLRYREEIHFEDDPAKVAMRV